MFKYALAMILLAASFSAQAQKTKISIPGYGNVSYEEIFRETSMEGETLDQFMVRISPRLRAYSDKTGYEACASIGTDGKRFGVVVGTNHAHIACAVMNRFQVDGMQPTVESLHSHGGERPFSSTKSDDVFMADTLAHAKKLGTRRVVHGQVLDRFSEMDMGSGSGYLATPTGVLHQDTKNIRVVR